MDLDIDIELIKAEIEAGNRYAGFYESVTKDSKEAGVADGWLNSYFRDSWPVSEVTFPENDPPDCECHYADGTVVAVEITELVDRRTIKRSEKLERSKKLGRSKQHLEVDDYEWSAEALNRRLCEIVLTKEKKLKKRGSSLYARKILLIHSDESLVTVEAVQTVFNAGECTSDFFEDIFFIMPPQPRLGGGGVGIPEEEPHQLAHWRSSTAGPI